MSAGRGPRPKALVEDPERLRSLEELRVATEQWRLAEQAMNEAAIATIRQGSTYREVAGVMGLTPNTAFNRFALKANPPTE